MKKLLENIYLLILCLLFGEKVSKKADKRSVFQFLYPEMPPEVFYEEYPAHYPDFEEENDDGREKSS